jgi:hypothetical protein
MDGYRGILEFLTGGVAQPNTFPPTNQPQPQYQGVNSPYATPNGTIHGPGNTLGSGASSPQPQSTPQRRFHYSFTTYGPDGSVRHFSSDPQSGPAMPPGRQIAVPTVPDFLGLHSLMGPYPGGAQGGDPYMMIRNLLEGVMPMHGNFGDYLHPVIPPLDAEF